MTSCCPPPRTRWSGAIGAIARCKRVSIACGRASRAVPGWRWTCGVKPTPKAGNTPLHPCIVHGLDKPGGFTTVSAVARYIQNTGGCQSVEQCLGDDLSYAPRYQRAIVRED